jgi:hypothetical protein
LFDHLISECANPQGLAFFCLANVCQTKAITMRT